MFPPIPSTSILVAKLVLEAIETISNVLAKDKS